MIMNKNNNNSNVLNSHMFSNGVNLNLIKNTNKIKQLNDKNNNNDEENYENQYLSLRRCENESLEQTVNKKKTYETFADFVLIGF